jgi:hypothetical protein
MIFLDDLHKKFYEDSVLRTNCSRDPYRKALFYTLGLTSETRDNINTLYDFKLGCINFDALQKGWQTGTSRKVTRLAFNLFDGMAYDSEEDFSNSNISKYYVVDEIFCCGLAPYFWEAIKLRYPEYTKLVDPQMGKEGCGVDNKTVFYPIADEKVVGAELFVDDTADDYTVGDADERVRPVEKGISD